MASEATAMDTEETSKSSDDSKGVSPHGWSREDKYLLLEALKKNHSSCIDEIHKMIPWKPIKEIKDVIAFHRKKAQNHPLVKNRKKMSRQEIWAKLMADQIFASLDTETAAAVRMFAELKDIPSGTINEGVDFRAIYQAIEEAIEKHSSPPDEMVNTDASNLSDQELGVPIPIQNRQLADSKQVSSEVDVNIAETKPAEGGEQKSDQSPQ